MVYTNYTTIYDDTEASRNRSTTNPDGKHYAHMHYEYTTRGGVPAENHQSRHQKSAPLPPPPNDTKRYRSQLNLHTKGNRANLDQPEYFIPNYVNRRSSSANPSRGSSLTRRLDFLDAKYGRLRHEPILEESQPSYPIYSVNDGDRTSSSSMKELNSSLSSTYRYYDVEIPIQRARNTYHFDLPSEPSYQYYQPNKTLMVPSGSVANLNGNNNKQSTLKLDVEIVRPKTETEASRKSKSYEVRNY